MTIETSYACRTKTDFFYNNYPSGLHFDIHPRLSRFGTSGLHLVSVEALKWEMGVGPVGSTTYFECTIHLNYHMHIIHLCTPCVGERVQYKILLGGGGDRVFGAGHHLRVLCFLGASLCLRKGLVTFGNFVKWRELLLDQRDLVAFGVVLNSIDCSVAAGASNAGGGVLPWLDRKSQLWGPEHPSAPHSRSGPMAKGTRRGWRRSFNQGIVAWARFNGYILPHPSIVCFMVLIWTRTPRGRFPKAAMISVGSRSSIP